MVSPKKLVNDPIPMTAARSALLETVQVPLVTVVTPKSAPAVVVAASNVIATYVNSTVTDNVADSRVVNVPRSSRRPFIGSANGRCDPDARP